MIESRYNFWFNYNNNSYVFNTRTCGLLQIEKVNICNELYKKYLSENKFIFEDSFNEASDFDQLCNSDVLVNHDTFEITILLTNQCNFNCIYCYQDHVQKSLSIETAEKFIEITKKLLLKFNYKQICIHYFGGEPLINFDVLKFIHKKMQVFCNEGQIKYYSYITTNASLLTKKRIVEMDFNTIQITFDGFKDTHNKFRKNNILNYDETINKIQEILLYSNSRIVIRFNLCEENKNDYQSVIKQICSLGRELLKARLSFNPSRMISYSNKEFTMLTPKKYAEIYYEFATYLMSEFNIDAILPKPFASTCQFYLGTALCVDTNLDLLQCSASNAAKGNYNEFSISSNRAFELPKECYKCHVLPLCMNCCPKFDNVYEACVPEKFILEKLLHRYLNHINQRDDSNYSF